MVYPPSAGSDDPPDLQNNNESAGRSFACGSSPAGGAVGGAGERDHDGGLRIGRQPRSAVDALASTAERARAAEYPRAPLEPDTAFLAIVECRGVAVGDGNRQFNLFVYRIENPEIDLAQVLARPAVRKALVELAEAQPHRRDAKAAMDRAVGALTATSLLPAFSGGIDFGNAPHDDLVDLQPTTNEFHRSVIIRACQGVQVGDHRTQHNTFAHISRHEHVDAVQLLRRNRALAYALIDYAIGRGNPSSVDDALSRTLGRAVDRQVDRSPRTTVVNRYPRGTIQGKAGVCVGYRNTVKNSTKVQFDLKATNRGLRRTLDAARTKPIVPRPPRRDPAAVTEPQTAAVNPPSPHATTEPDVTHRPSVSVRPSGASRNRDYTWLPRPEADRSQYDLSPSPSPTDRTKPPSDPTKPPSEPTKGPHRGIGGPGR